jgi:glycoprotein-N-acetylgalactosamine 3-beta-galactosyltransferase
MTRFRITLGFAIAFVSYLQFFPLTRMFLVASPHAKAASSMLKVDLGDMPPHIVVTTNQNTNKKIQKNKKKVEKEEAKEEEEEEAVEKNDKGHVDVDDDKCHNPAVAFLTVAPPVPKNQREPKILCFVLTHQENHDTRIRAIWDTWGNRCDKLVVASSNNDKSVNAVQIKGRQGYWWIWDKLQKTLIHLQNNYRDDGYDWILKADDDSYVIMENLKAFLANQEAAREKKKGKANEDRPLIYGRIMTVPTLGTLKTEWKWFSTIHNREFARKLYQKFDTNMPMSYAHGGPGYVMNWKYVDRLIQVIQGDNELKGNVVRGKVGEDTANAVTMLLQYNVRPLSTGEDDPKRKRSGVGVERSHPEPPHVMFENPTWLKEKQEHIDNTGNGTDCCAPDSISYHHLTPEDMRLLDYQLYKCPQRKRQQQQQQHQQDGMLKSKMNGKH